MIRGRLLVGAVLLALTPSASAAVMHACGARLECGRVQVPLDPSGQVAGTVSLAVERYEPTGNDSAGTIVGLAGGPGQSAIGVADGLAHDMGTALTNRALVVFDPRGVGFSSPLECAPESLAQCAVDLGPRRRFYSTVDSVADIESVRSALGLGQISLYGVSYGTFTALAYARAYPANVQRLVLDSIVPADGDPPVKLSTLAAMQHLYGQCEVTCPGPSPFADLTHALGSRPYGPGSRLLSDLAFQSMYDSDLSPLIRAELPAALRLAAEHRTAAMFHVNDLALGLEAGDARDAPATVNVAGDATKCEDVRFPWAAGDPASVRRADIASATAALPASIVFDPDSVIGSSPFSECLGWPDAGNDPPRITQALPAVPALLISGAHDVRTPLADAAALAGQLPNATLLPVPDTGHSVLATDASGCARAAVGAFFAGTAIAQCPAEAPEPVDPLPPRSAAALAPAPPLAGTPGRVLRAVALTLRHDIGLGFEYIVAGNSGAGTAGGFVDVVGHGPNAHVVLRGLSYVPDVRLTGSLRLGSFRHAPGTLVIALGRNKHYGKITLSSGGSMAGTLGGRRFRLSWPARQAIDRAGGLAVLPSD